MSRPAPSVPRVLALVVLAWLVAAGAMAVPPAEARVTPGEGLAPARATSPTPSLPAPAQDAPATLATASPTVVEASPGDADPSPPPAPASPPGPGSAPTTPPPAPDRLPSPTPSAPDPVPDRACTGPVHTVEVDPATAWRDVVVDPVRRLPEDWAPDDLVEVGGVGYHGAPAPQVRQLVVADLQAMHRAATRADARFVVVSAFRSEDRQARVWDRAVASEGGVDAARAGTASPGHSEHQLGTTIDVVDPDLPELVPGLADTPAGRWLAVHAVEFGFVVSYPDGATAATCYKPEPWHLRYVGRERAAEMAAFPLSPREFLLDRLARSS